MRVARLFAFLLAASCASCVGDGFRLVPRSVKSTGFEGIAHYTDLYCGSTRVASAVGNRSISPSGRFAAFEDNGHVRLYDRRTKVARDVTDGTFAIPRCFSWDEAAGEVRVEYYERNGYPHSRSVIRLPA